MKSSLPFYLVLIVLLALVGISGARAQDCDITAPYVSDDHTLLLLHFDGSYEAEGGEAPIEAIGTEFTAGVFGDGVLIDDDDLLRYYSAGNLIAEQGAIEFWVRPNWDGDDPYHHPFLAGGAAINIYKDGADNFRFILNSDDSEAYQAWNMWSWIAGDWHHVAVTWTIPGEMKTYIDGVLRIAHPASAQDLISLPASLTIGQVGYGVLDGVIDEFRISDIPRYCEGPTAPPLACVGFHPPMDAYPVTVKKNRALPLKAEVFDADGVAMTDNDLIATPVIQVLFDSGSGDEPVDVTDDALSAGQGTEGNQFEFTDGGKWQFNLKTKDYTASGTYWIYMLSGDESEYVIDPTCETAFVID